MRISKDNLNIYGSSNCRKEYYNGEVNKEKLEKLEELRILKEHQKYIICAYNSSHIIPEGDYQFHITNCSENLGDNNLLEHYEEKM